MNEAFTPIVASTAFRPPPLQSRVSTKPVLCQPSDRDDHPNAPPLVTGLGAVSPLGTGLTSYIRGLREAHSGIKLLGFEHPAMASTVAAHAVGFDPGLWLDPADQRRLPRLIPMALAAATEATAHAALDVPLRGSRSQRVGLVLGTGGGGIDFTLDQVRKMNVSQRASLWSVTNATHGNLAGELSIRLGLRGPSLCVSTGCASSSDAIGLAADLLRSNRPGSPDAMVVVGADAHIRWETLAGMEWLGVISTRDYRDDPASGHAACKPFDRRRDGFVLGEGAWAVVLERPAFHQSRAGPEPVGEILGYGSTCDAYHRVRPDPNPTEAVRAIREALLDAHLTPDKLGAVQYHGTATPINDRQESLALIEALGDRARAIPGSSIKGAIGHPQGACGLASLVAMLGSLGHREPFIPPTLHLEQADPDCPLDYTPLAPRQVSADEAIMPFLVNCLAFGAKNSTLIARAHRPGS